MIHMLPVNDKIHKGSMKHKTHMLSVNDKIHMLSVNDKMHIISVNEKYICYLGMTKYGRKEHYISQNIIKSHLLHQVFRGCKKQVAIKIPARFRLLV